MKLFWGPRRTGLLLACIGGVLAAGPGSVGLRAGESCRAFLDALRERQYFDAAVDYLDQMRDNPSAPEGFKELIDYEKGSLLLEGVKSAAPGQQEKQLEQAEQSFQAFLKGHPQHPLVAGAQAQLAKVLAIRAGLQCQQALRSGRPAEEKQRLLGEARESYEKARQAFAEAEKQVVEAGRQPSPAGAPDAQAAEHRRILDRDLFSARMASASLLSDLAQTYDAGSPQRSEQMKAAAAAFAKLFDENKRLPAAYYAKLGEAECWSKLGEPAKALQALEPVLKIEDGRENLREIRDQALLAALEIETAPPSKQFKEAARQAQAWLGAARERDLTSPDGQAIKYFGGVALLELARGAKLPLEKLQAVDGARKLLNSAARSKGAYQQRARAKLSDALLGGKTAAKEATTFAEADERGQQALERLSSLDLVAQNPPAEGDNPQQRKADAAEARSDAREQFQLALRLAASERGVDPKALNHTRYCLAYVYWSGDQAWEAATLGEFVLERYPEHPDALPAAKVAMAAYMALYALVPPGEDRQFEMDRTRAVAREIAERWPKQPDTEDAWLTLARTALLGNEADGALEYLTYVSADSPRRADADLLAGQALWIKYSQARQLPAESRPDAATLNKLLTQAEGKLSAAVQRLTPGAGAQASPSLVGATLALAQVCVLEGKPARAVELLEDPQFGPLRLAEKKDPAATDAILPEIYKLALRAYVGHHQLDKAEQAMRTLEQLLGSKGDPQANALLMQTYIRIGQELQSQLQTLREAHQADELAEVSRGFELFLSRIAEADQQANFNTLAWVADTFRSMGQGLDSGGRSVPAEVRDYYQRSADAYGRLLERCARDPAFAPSPEAVLGAKLRMSHSLRRLGRYKEALNVLCEILQAGTNLSAQVEAAYTYQAWGDEEPPYFDLAVAGGRPQKQADGSVTRLVWGWARIAKMVQPHLDRDPRYKEIFFEARYNIPLCRLKLSATLDPQKKAAAVSDAQRDISIIAMLYPDMGGGEWFAKFDALLKTIEKLQNLPPTGLPRPDAAKPAAPAPAAAKP